jgi:hypothetical protein
LRPKQELQEGDLALMELEVKHSAFLNQTMASGNFLSLVLDI